MTLKALNRLVGTWTTEASHPALPGIVVQGTSTIEWLEGEQFLIYRAVTDHPDFPDFISIIGYTERDRAEEDESPDRPPPENAPMAMHYFDSRGVSRIYEVSIDDQALRIWRNAAGFSQRFTGKFADSGDTITGRWQLREDDVHWNDDLEITYRRRK